MSSPDNFNIQINKEAETPIYLQIAMEIINAIQRGFLPSHAPLPGTRTLSEKLNVHRKTVIAAYQELMLQGWINSIPNKGTFVSIQNKPFPDFYLLSQSNNPLLDTPAFKFTKNNMLEPIETNPKLQYSISDGLPDIRLSPIKEISSLYTTTLKKNINQKHFGYDGNTNTIFCKQQLCNFIKKTSGLNVRPQNILITSSFETAVLVAATTLLTKNDVVVVGNLSYYVSNMIFQQAGATIVTIPVDHEGLCVEALEEICKTKKIRMIHVMPSQQYPTTFSLSAQRRAKLLQLSKKYGFIILEDEYEYEFTYDISANTSFIHANTGLHSVHIGSFGKSLPPGYRITYLIAATDVIAEMNKYLSIINRQGSPLNELVLANFIAEGNAYRHLKKMQKVYKEKRNYFIQLLQKNLSNYIAFHIPTSGLAIWAIFKTQINLVKLSEYCRIKSLWLPTFLLYQNKNICAIRLGFGDLNEDEMKKIISILKSAIKSIHQQDSKI